jgi:hypothetical protein
LVRKGKVPRRLGTPAMYQLASWLLMLKPDEKTFSH